MSGPPPTDIATTALAIALCDLLAYERAKLMALLKLLERKGLVSAAELSGAIEAIGLLPPGSAEADQQRLQTKLQERMTIRYQELLLHSGQSGPAQ